MYANSGGVIPLSSITFFHRKRSSVLFPAEVTSTLVGRLIVPS